MRCALLILLVGCADTDTDTDTDGPATTTTTATPPPICINEVMASNATSYEEGGSFPDWVELHNPTDAAIDLDDWFVSDKVDEPMRAALTDLRIEAGGYLLIFPDGDVEEGADHLSFKLSAGGEAFVLTAPDSAGELVQWSSFTTDVSLARETDCCEGDCWVEVAGGTPGTANQ